MRSIEKSWIARSGAFGGQKPRTFNHEGHEGSQRKPNAFLRGPSCPSWLRLFVFSRARKRFRQGCGESLEFFYGKSDIGLRHEAVAFRGCGRGRASSGKAQKWQGRPRDDARARRQQGRDRETVTDELGSFLRSLSRNLIGVSGWPAGRGYNSNLLQIIEPTACNGPIQNSDAA